MRRFNGLIGGFVRDARGTTSIEYGLIVALVAVGMLAGLQALGVGNGSSWNQSSDKITSAMKKGGN